LNPSGIRGSIFLKGQRGALLTILAVLFALGAIQDFLKPFRFEGPWS